MSVATAAKRAAAAAPLSLWRSYAVPTGARDWDAVGSRVAYPWRLPLLPAATTTPTLVRRPGSNCIDLLMSSDEYFDDELDSAFLNEVDAIEAAHVSVPTAAANDPPVAQPAPKPPPKVAFKPARVVRDRLPAPSKMSSVQRATPPDVIELQDSSSDYAEFFDDFPAVDDAALAQIDQEVERQLDEHHRKKAQPFGQPVAGPSNSNGLVRRPSRGAQLNLFGELAQETEAASKSGESNKRTFQRTRSTLRQMPLPGQAKRTKQWDRTAYAKTGWRKPKDMDKGKGRASDGEDEEERIEFEQFPAPQIPVM